MTEETVEQEIQRKGLDAPRVKPADIDAAIVSHQFHVFRQSCLTVCCLTLQNGFTVTGESACASPENFDAAVGVRVSFENAKQKIWPLLGYALKQRLHEQAANTIIQLPPIPPGYELKQVGRVTRICPIAPATNPAVGD